MNGVATEAEEVYRQQALDYTKCHSATSVREDTVQHSQTSRGSSLLTLLLKAASEVKSSSHNQSHRSAFEGMNELTSRAPALLLREDNLQGISLDAPDTTHPNGVESDSKNGCDDEAETLLQQSLDFAAYNASSQEENHENVSTVQIIGSSSETEQMINDLAFAVKKKKRQNGIKKKTKYAA